MSQRVTDFVVKYYPFAIRSEQQTGIPAVFTLAQAALETGWGSKAIGNNLFGITANRLWTGPKVLVDTFEFHDTPDVQYPEISSIEKLPNGKYKYIVKRYFREYADVSECFNDHYKVLLQDRYKEAFKYTDDPKRFATEIARGGYATGLNYASTLHQIIDMVQRVVDTLGQSQPAVSTGAMAVVKSRALNLRQAGSNEATLMIRDGLQRGAKLVVLGQAGAWLKVRTEETAWCATRFLSIADRGGENWATVTASLLNYRHAPEGIKIGAFSRGESYPVAGTQGDWTKIYLIGWVHGDFVEYANA